MLYRQLGKRTGLKISQLGFGAMRLPMKEQDGKKIVDRELSTPMIHRAFEGGVNYIDTAVFYCDGDSESAVGDALKSWGKREEIIVSTKNFDQGEDEKKWWGILEDSLKKLQVEYIDIYHNHGIQWNSYVNNIEPRIGKWMQKAKDQGLIKHICFSFHDAPDALIKLINTDYGDVVTLQYNMLDRQLEDGINLAHEKGMGVVVMGPVAGGRLGAPSDVFTKLIKGVDRVPELALRFVLANPNVSLALSGMSTMRQVEENLITASDESPLSADDMKKIDEHLEKLKNMKNLYCTGCRYCMPCPQEVNIPSVFDKYNLGKVYGLWDAAKDGYAFIERNPWEKGKNAGACVKCGQCEPKCPQKIPIMAQLEEAHKILASK